MTGEYSIDEEVAARCSPELIDLIKKLLNVDDTNRITMPEILKHPWVTKDNLAPTKKEPKE